MKLNTLRSLLVLFPAMLFAATACQPEETPTPDNGENNGNEKEELILEVTLGSVTHNSAEATVTPSIEDATYYAGIHTAEELGEDASAYAERLMNSSSFKSRLLTGTKTVSKSELTPETDYWVLAFGWNETDKLNTEILTHKVTTTAEPAPEFAYTISLALEEGSVTWRDAVVNVTASADDCKYVFDILPKAEWDEKYSEDPESVVAARIAGWQNDVLTSIETYPNLDTWQKWMALFQETGSKTMQVSEYESMYWGTEYVFYCFGMDAEGTQTSKVEYLSFTTESPKASENNITITVKSTTKSTVEFDVTASNDDPYFVSIQDTGYLGRWNEETHDEMIFDLVSTKTDYQLEANIFAGTRSFTNADFNKTVNGFKEYQVVIWGFENGPTTKVVFSETFKPGTTHQPLPPFTMSSANETWCDADVTITPSDNKVSYIVGGLDKATFDSEYASNLDGLYEKEKAQWVKEEEWYNKTWIENMQYYLYNGEVNETASYLIGMERLNWSTEYVIYCFGVNTETGEKTTDVQTLTVTTATPVASANTFDITIHSTTKSTVEFTVTPSTDDPYYVTVQRKSVVDSHSADLLEYLMSSVTENQLESRTFTGAQDLTNSSVGATVNGFYEYQVIVWGFENGPTTAVTISEAFKPGTTHQPLPPFTMSAANETWCDADVTITPSDNKVSYIVGGLDKATFDSEYASNLDGLYEKEKAQWVKEEDWYNKTWIENMQYYLYNGEVSETASYLIGMERLNWSTEYVIYCFGVNTETGAKTTDVHTLTVTTATPTPSANTFTITIDAMTKSSVEFTVTPTTDDPYYVTVQKKSVVDSHSADLLEYLMSSVTEAQLESRTFTGTQTLKNSQVGATVNGFYEYQIVVWGFNNGPTTEVTLSEAFKPADPVVEE